jgi:2-methylcitrate dehydratase PrpD
MRVVAPGDSVNDGSVTDAGYISFIHDLGPGDLRPDVRKRVRACLADLVGVAAAGSRTPLAALAREHAHRHLRGADGLARLYFDGRAVSPVGAAFANAAAIDAMDGHDGHRLTKGHAGAAVLPAATSVIDPAAHDVDDLLVALLVGYEIANRAGMRLHRTAADYHSSGAWNALGAAAVTARLLGLDAEATRHALGIAEHHAPRAPMMRCIDHPTMVKDSSAQGAQAGVSAALLARDGFTGPPAELVGRPGATDEPSENLGRRWTVLE